MRTLIRTRPGSKPGGYRKDLAFIHDEGFSAFSMKAVAGLKVFFEESRPPGKQVVELGCGSGRLARSLLKKGFAVTGVDASPSMIALARHIAPGGRFSVGSVWSCDIPRCAVVLAIGEVLNYQFDGEVSIARIRALFSRAYDALLPSGLLVFDILCTRDSKKVAHTMSFTESGGWLVAVEKTDSSRSLTRRIITFRRDKGVYRRSVEVHTVRRHDPKRVISVLRDIGFSVSTRRGYHTEALEPGHVVIIGRKPSHKRQEG